MKKNCSGAKETSGMTIAIRYLLEILVVFLFIITSTVINGFNVEALIVSEVELNPEGSDIGNEWVELYSDIPIDLEGYYLINADGQIYNLTGKIDNYLVVKFPKQWLDNSAESVTLIDNESILGITPDLADSKDSGFTWSLCGDQWFLGESSEGSENICPQNDSETPEQNETNDDTDESVEDNEESSDENEEGYDDVIDTANYTENSEVVNKEYDQLDFGARNEKIVLGTKLQESTKKEYITGYGWLRESLIYVFSGSCLLILVLFAMNKLK